VVEVSGPPSVMTRDVLSSAEVPQGNDATLPPAGEAATAAEASYPKD